MSKKEEKLLVVVAAALVIFAFVYYQDTDSVFFVFVKQFTGVDWDEVKERDIVKNSIPIVLIDEINGECKVSALRFDYIIDHQYFIRASDLERQLNYDREDATLMLSCDQLKGEKSRLVVWYVVEESEKHSKKYEYWITAWNNTQP